MSTIVGSATLPSSTRAHVANSERQRSMPSASMRPDEEHATEINFHARDANAARATSGEHDRSCDRAQLDARTRRHERAPMRRRTSASRPGEAPAREDRRDGEQLGTVARML